MKKMKLFLGVMALTLAFGVAFVVKTNVAEAHTRTVKIRVDKNGFSPSTIELEAGHKVNLVFNRADRNNCGSTVVFPKLKVRKALPVGKDVIVSFTPREAGQMTFTCGMKMYKGSIVIAD